MSQIAMFLFACSALALRTRGSVVESSLGPSNRPRARAIVSPAHGRSRINRRLNLAKAVLMSRPKSWATQILARQLPSRRSQASKSEDPLTTNVHVWPRTGEGIGTRDLPLIVQKKPGDMTVKSGAHPIAKLISRPGAKAPHRETAPNERTAKEDVHCLSSSYG